MNAADILMYGHRTLHEAIQGIPDAGWETPNVCGVWSSKDVLSHLTSYEWMLVDVLTGFTGAAGDTPTLSLMLSMDGDAFNEVQVGQRQATFWRDVLRELDEAYERVMALAQQIPKDTWAQAGTLPWYGGEYGLDDFIVYTFYGHKREHSAQLNVFKDVVKGRGAK